MSELIRYLLLKLHNSLERYCSRTVGKAMIHRQGTGKWPSPDPTVTWKFKIASRLEFKLRYLFGRKRYCPMWLPKYEHYVN